jgi:hypothetical protein
MESRGRGPITRTMSTYHLTVNAPRWWYWRGLGWLRRLARLLGPAKRWEARGTGLMAFEADLRRLAFELGACVVYEAGEAQYRLQFYDGRDYTVVVESQP